MEPSVEQTPFLLVELRREIFDPSLKSTSHGSEAMAWMACEPADWSGFAQRLGACAPEGGALRIGAWEDAKTAREQGGRFCVQLEGLGAPWVPAESLEWGDWSAPRMPTLSLTMVFEAEVPRVWNKAWDEEIAKRWVEEPGLEIERALRAQGFGELWALGFEPNAQGSRHPTNMAAVRWAAWVARREAGELEMHARGSLGSGGARL